MTGTTRSGQAASAGANLGETVLVVEDEPRLRKVTVARLGDLGYRTLEAGDAGAAIALLDAHPEISVLFSDIVMPGEMSGLELARRVREQHPKVRIILTSGYAAELSQEEHEGLDLRILYKPFTMANLEQVFSEALRPR